MAVREKKTTTCDKSGCSASTTKTGVFTHVSVGYSGPDGSGVFTRDYCGTHGPEVVALLDEQGIITIPRAPEGGE